MAAAVIKDLLAETRVPAGALDEVICGNILPAGLGQGPARQAAIYAGIPAEVPAYAINIACGSGMKAVMNAAAAIKSGQGTLFIAGGMENMSMAPYLIPGARQGLRMGNKELTDHMLHDALTDAFNAYHMGITAENVAEKHGISREAQDAFSMGSQEKALAAIDAGAFKNEIVPITVKSRKQETVVDTDEYPNRGTSLQKLAGLKPAFKKDGTVTAGNASGINDGAAFMLVASEDAVAKYGLEPIAELMAFGQGGVDPSVMGLGPVPAIRKALEMGGLTLADMEIIELNEAFAAQSLGVVAELSNAHGMTQADILARTNLNGGAIALGHPVGASGARIMVTLAHLLRAKGRTLGLASLCIGGGMGTAVILKSV
jgi:acetyl-CoA C-acetyltransferase